MATFAEEYWSRRPLLSRAADLPRDFSDLLTPADADELLSRRGLRTPFLRVARNGEVLPPARFTGPGGAGAGVGDQVSDDKLLGLFAAGATLVLQGLHRLWPPVIEFGAGLAAELGHPVQINAYLTPPQSQGFAAHYDVHDVFVLQTAGRKRWRIHAPVLTEPLRDQPWTDRRAAVAEAATGQPVLDEVLEPGDALYLPRGWLHSAVALGGSTGHLTVGIHNLTRYAVAEALLRELTDDPELRRSLPLGVDPGAPGALVAEVAAVRERLRARLPEIATERVADRVGGTLRAGVRPAPLAPMAQAAFAAGLGPADRIVRRPHLRIAVGDDGPGLRLRLDGRTVRVPAAESAAARQVLLAPAGPHVVADLPAPDDDTRLAAARRLLLEGLAVPAPGP